MFHLSNEPQKLEIFEIVEAKLKVDLAFVMMLAMKDRLKHEILPSIRPKNFTGEARTYLKDHGIEQTDANVLKQANLMYEDFTKHIEDQIAMDNYGNVYLRGIVGAFEYGDYFNPALKFVTKTLEISNKRALKYYDLPRKHV